MFNEDDVGQQKTFKENAPQGGNVKLQKFVNSLVIFEENFKRLPEKIRIQIIQAEAMLTASQENNGQNRLKLEEAVLIYLKCFEELLNDTFIFHLREVEGHKIFVTKDHDFPKLIRSSVDKDKTRVVKLKDSHQLFNLSQIKMLIDTPSFFSHTSLDYVFRNKKPFWEYCRLELRTTLKNESLIDLRNSLTTDTLKKPHDRELLLVRNILLGLGGRGILNDLIEAWQSPSGEIQKSA